MAGSSWSLSYDLNRIGSAKKLSEETEEMFARSLY